MYGYFQRDVIMISEEKVTLESAALKRSVTVSVLMPESWSAPEPLHLLLLNDGQELENLQVAEAMEKLYEKGRMKQVMVAAVHAGERIQEYGTAGRPDVKKRGSRAGAYAAFITEELLPFLQTYTGLESFASTAIAGCSLGALSALDIAWNHPEHFDRVGAFSGSFWWRSALPGKGYNDGKHRIMHQVIRQKAGKPALKFWFEAGTKDELADRNKNGIIDAIDDTVDLIVELEAKGYRRPEDIRYMEIVGGRHDTETWSRAMPKFLEWAFGK